MKSRQQSLLAQQNRRLKGTIRELRARLREKKEEATDIGLRGAKERFTVRGGMAIALRRCISHVAAARIGTVLMTDVHHKTVTAWEQRLCAALLGSKRAAHSEHRFHLQEAMRRSAAEVGGTGRFVTLHAITCDATNANVWQKTKLHNLQLQSLYVADDVSDMKSHQDLSVVRGFADVKPMDSQLPTALHALIVDQMSALGCRTWHEEALGVQQQQRVCHTDIWLICTDAGGDIRSARKQICATVEPAKHHLVFQLNCMMHQLHLAVRSGLNVLEQYSQSILSVTYTYSSRLATLMHVWRDVNRKVFKAADGDSTVKTMPPRLVGGRWNSISECERYILKTSTTAREGLSSVLASFKTRKTNPDKADDAGATFALL